MARYGKKAQEKVKEAMHEMKEGKLKSGRSGQKVTSRKQAIAIGLSEAREAGSKVPAKKTATKKTAAKKTAAKQAPGKRRAAAKTASKSGSTATKRTTSKTASKTTRR